MHYGALFNTLTSPAQSLLPSLQEAGPRLQSRASPAAALRTGSHGFLIRPPESVLAQCLRTSLHQHVVCALEVVAVPRQPQSSRALAFPHSPSLEVGLRCQRLYQSLLLPVPNFSPECSRPRRMEGSLPHLSGTTDGEWKWFPHIGRQSKLSLLRSQWFPHIGLSSKLT